MTNNSDRLDLASPNLVHQNIEKIAALFPHCVTETAEGKGIDFDLLKQELSEQIIEGTKERYRLEWPGKREAIVTANLPTNNTLRPIIQDSVNFDSTQNAYIEGDNLEVLKLLQESYLGKIKMIYIDPPYNTGNDFVYKDNFTQSTEAFKTDSGLVDEFNQRLVANPDTAGRYHSDWLSMMYPRLKLARNLLTDDGVIFISIDDNEIHNLRKICDEVFGEGNFIGCIIRTTGQTTGQDSDGLGASFDYLLVYSKGFQQELKGLPLTQHDLKRFENKDEKGKYAYDQMRKTGSNDRRSDRPNMYYPIIDPDGNQVYPTGPTGYESRWRFEKKTYEKLLDDNFILWKKTKKDNVEVWWPYVKYYLEGRTKRPSPLWDDLEGNKKASRDLKTVFDGDKLFDFPKPLEMIDRVLRISTEKDSIILDFFSGSATTAHAVMQLNAEDGGNRKHIMVQLPEATDEKSEAYKAGYQNICEIGKERIRRAGKKIVEELQAKLVQAKAKLAVLDEKLSSGNGTLLMDNDPKVEALRTEQNELQSQITDLEQKIDGLDIGFRVYRLDTSNMKDVYYSPKNYFQDQLDAFDDNIKDDRSAEDLVAQIMLDWGLPLSLKIEKVQIAGKEVFKIEKDSLLACFSKAKDIDENFARAIAPEKPLRVVFRDSSFKDDTAKENVKQLLKQLSPNTEMRVI